MKIISTAFKHEADIPSIHTCDGNDQSPALTWEGVPKEAKSLSLIMDDPDAPGGTFIHWVVFNIDPKLTGLPANVSKSSVSGFSQGTNSKPDVGYMGPCPPSGRHKYRFKLYALDNVLSLSSSSKEPDLTKAMKGHIISQAELLGYYKRAK